MIAIALLIVFALCVVIYAADQARADADEIVIIGNWHEGER